MAQDGVRVAVGNSGFNATIAANGGVLDQVGFVGSWNGRSNSRPTNFHAEHHPVLVWLR